MLLRVGFRLFVCRICVSCYCEEGRGIALTWREDAPEFYICSWLVFCWFVYLVLVCADYLFSIYVAVVLGFERR